MAKNQGKKPEQKKEGVLSRAAHAVSEALHPQHAEPSEVEQILDQVSEQQGDGEVKSAEIKKESPRGQSVEAKKNYEQHPKFHKFKGAK